MKGQKGEPGPPGLDQPCPVVCVGGGGPLPRSLPPPASVFSVLRAQLQVPEATPALPGMPTLPGPPSPSLCHRGSSCSGLTPPWPQLGRPAPSLERGALLGAEPVPWAHSPSLLCSLTHKGGRDRPSLSDVHPVWKGAFCAQDGPVPSPCLSSTCPRPLPSPPPQPPMAHPTQCLK